MAEAHNNLRPQPYEPVHLFEADTQPKVETTTGYERHPVRKEWPAEIATSFLSLGSLTAIAIIFWRMDDKPLSAWDSLISLNAVVSILTTGCTMLMKHGVSEFIGQSKWRHFKSRPRRLFDLQAIDEASRGAWGSFLLFLRIKSNIVFIGAFILLLEPVFSPFTQQVVKIEQRDTISSVDSAAFGYAHNYTVSEQYSLWNSGDQSIPQDPGMQSAIFQGLYSMNTTEPFSCPGICRWNGTWISLGFKAGCQNVTQETLKTTTCQGGDPGMERCNMTTPGGVRVATHRWTTDLVTAYYMNATSLAELDQSTKDLQVTFPEIMRFAIYRSTPDGDFYARNINITECSLSLAAYQYTGAKANGSDFSFDSRREVDFGVKNPWALNSYEEAINTRRGGHIRTKELQSGDTRIPALEMNYRSLTALRNFFQSPVITTEWVEGNFVNENLGLSAALSGDVDLDDRFDKMATAMTDYLRYGPNSLSARGKSVHSEPYVSIRWWYIIVPVLIEGLAILFAILSIFRNRRSRCVPVWKSSALAVLACQHDEQLGLLQTTGRDLDKIEEEAKKTKVQLH